MDPQSLPAWLLSQSQKLPVLDPPSAVGVVVLGEDGDDGGSGALGLGGWLGVDGAFRLDGWLGCDRVLGLDTTLYAGTGSAGTS